MTISFNGLNEFEEVACYSLYISAWVWLLWLEQLRNLGFCETGPYDRVSLHLCVQHWALIVKSTWWFCWSFDNLIKKPNQTKNQNHKTCPPNSSTISDHILNVFWYVLIREPKWVIIFLSVTLQQHSYHMHQRLAASVEKVLKPVAVSYPGFTTAVELPTPAMQLRWLSLCDCA